VTEVPEKELKSYLTTSKVCIERTIPAIVRQKVQRFEGSNENFVRSVGVLYQGGLISKRKYQAIRNNDSLKSSYFMNNTCVPRIVPYNKLIKYVNNIDIGKIYKLEELADSLQKPKVNGVYKNLEELLLRMSQMYLQVLPVADNITWFNGQDGCFYVAIGADGAPFGKDDSATAFLVSFLNILDGVASCNNNFLLMGSNCSETHPLMFSYVQHVVAEMEAIEAKEYVVLDRKVTFRCRLIPADQKWHACMGGELSNAATFFSTYANVSSASSQTKGGSIGDKTCTWQPWSYKKRLEVADQVSIFKAKNKLGEKCSTSERSKVTKFIAGKSSRQEFKPFLGKYIDNAMPDPLHNTNNAWQKWHLQVLFIALKLVKPEVIKKSANDVSKLPDDCVFVKYLNCLETTVKCGRLLKNIIRWFNENKSGIKASEFSYRFTGKESKLFCWNFMYIISTILEQPGLDEKTKIKLYSLAFHGLTLRNSVSLFSRVEVSGQDIKMLKENCSLYFNACAIFDTKASQTAWTIGYAIPYHTEILFSDLGYGLGLNTTQGREAKHTKLAKFAENTIKPKRWEQVMKHDFITNIWLKEQHPASQSSPKTKSSTGNQYIPEHCFLDNYCFCGLSKEVGKTMCLICSSDIMSLIRESCISGKINALLLQK